ncbi:MAG: hypothetical protein C4589_03930 [Peptococcaceae bacterium]|nr:MAG: hypothetical protein C4589_03930 [Peptococcaceae bacterium]
MSPQGLPFPGLRFTLAVLLAAPEDTKSTIVSTVRENLRNWGEMKADRRLPKFLKADVERGLILAYYELVTGTKTTIDCL